MGKSIELGVEKDYPYQRRQWTAERIGWCVMALFLIAGLAGVFGRGPLSRGEARHPDGLLAIEYERLARFHAPSELRVRLQPVPTAEDVYLSIPQSYLDGIMVKEIVPQPASARVDGETVVYRFLVEPETQSMEVLFRLKMETAGNLAGSVAAGNASLSFRQFVFP